MEEIGDVVQTRKHKNKETFGRDNKKQKVSDNMHNCPERRGFFAVVLVSLLVCCPDCEHKHPYCLLALVHPPRKSLAKVIENVEYRVALIQLRDYWSRMVPMWEFPRRGSNDKYHRALLELATRRIEEFRQLLNEQSRISSAL